MIETDSAAIEQCAKLLTDKKLTIAFAESATAGSLSAAFSKLPDAGSFLKGGLVCYDACLKEDILGVPDTLIKQYSPESTEVTRAMALGLKKWMQADVYVAITGLTRSGGSESKVKPVGTMFYCLVQNDRIYSCNECFHGNEDAIISQTIEQISKSIVKFLTSKN